MDNLALTPGLAFVLAYSAPVVFGFFSAWWAQQTGRNAWLWFAFGMLLTPLAGIVLLLLNADRARRSTMPASGEDLSHLLAKREDAP